MIAQLQFCMHMEDLAEMQKSKISVLWLLKNKSEHLKQGTCFLQDLKIGSHIAHKSRENI